MRKVLKHLEDCFSKLHKLSDKFLEGRLLSWIWFSFVNMFKTPTGKKAEPIFQYTGRGIVWEGSGLSQDTPAEDCFQQTPCLNSDWVFMLPKQFKKIKLLVHKAGTLSNISTAFLWYHTWVTLLFPYQQCGCIYSQFIDENTTNTSPWLGVQRKNT